MARSEDVDLWAMDEVRFQQHGSRCRMWILPETADPILLHNPTRRSVGYFGAVRLRDGKLAYKREVDRFNAETCFDFVHHLWKTSSRSGRRVVVISDNARYHHATLHKEWRNAAEPWFRFEYLPPYSPYRARVEIDSAPGHSQPVFPGDRGCGNRSRAYNRILARGQ